MKWTPDTHNISFEIEDGRVISFKSSDDKYIGRDVQEVYSEVVAEHQKINLLPEKDTEEIKEKFIKGEEIIL